MTCIYQYHIFMIYKFKLRKQVMDYQFYIYLFFIDNIGKTCNELRQNIM